MVDVRQNLSKVIFLGRWVQAPLYLGLIIILTAYVYHFLIELVALLFQVYSVGDTEIMLGVLDLIDIVMLANLLIMVIIGGYQTFVSPLYLQENSDRPEWLDAVNAGTMKVKLALSLIGISSIHLLRTFIDPSPVISVQGNYGVMWQVIIHLTLVVSALSIAFTNWVMDRK
jgi:uncharacterized protein (TIGR00645 family)